MTDQRTAMFAAGCFWGVEHRFAELDGVLDTEVGYAGGHTDQPSYREVCGGDTGHAEVVQVQFDADAISYDRLVREFFALHDPTQKNRQGPDVGSQYRSAIFCHDAAQRETAERVMRELNDGQYRGRIATEIADAPTFWRAEEYHQDYIAKQGGGACAI